MSKLSTMFVLCKGGFIQNAVCGVGLNVVFRGRVLYERL